MASYTVRVELKEQTEKMRIELHFTMLENGFSRSVVCDRGFTYALPSNEFVYVGSDGIKNLMDQVISLISGISEDPLCWLPAQRSAAGQGFASLTLSKRARRRD